MTSDSRTPVTISDVAAAAGVSTASVSGVINGRSRVSAATTARIEAVIRELGYQTNPSARQLRAGRSDAIGLVVPELDRPYFGELSSMIADEVAASGRHLVVQRSGGSHEAELAAASFARLRLYDGVIFSVVDLNPADIEKLQFSTPVVLVGERSGDNRFDHVAMDNVGGAKQATTHLLERGATRIALLGGDPSSVVRLPGESKARSRRNQHRSRSAIQMTKLRTQGFVEAHYAAGQDVAVDLIVELPDFSMESGRRAVIDLHSSGVPFDAVFAVTDVVALGALRALHELNISVPNQVQVIGFDDITESTYSIPALTTVNPCKDRIARDAVTMLNERIDGLASPARAVVVPASLTIRETTLP